VVASREEIFRFEDRKPAWPLKPCHNPHHPDALLATELPVQFNVQDDAAAETLAQRILSPMVDDGG